MSKKQKLELTWIGKENRPKLERRILLEDLLMSYQAKHRVKIDSREDVKIKQGCNNSIVFFAYFAASRENEIGDICG